MRFVCFLVLALASPLASAQTPLPVRFVAGGQPATVPAGNYLQTQEVSVR